MKTERVGDFSVEKKVEIGAKVNCFVFFYQKNTKHGEELRKCQVTDGFKGWDFCLEYPGRCVIRMCKCFSVYKQG